MPTCCCAWRASAWARSRAAGRWISAAASGRLSQGLAPHFAAVVGLDVAPGMLAEARRNAEADGLTNVAYHSSLDPGQLAPRSYDLVHSYIVLQHIPVATGEPIIARLIYAVDDWGSIGVFVLFRRDSGPGGQVPWTNRVRAD